MAHTFLSEESFEAARQSRDAVDVTLWDPPL
jgi:hypothetical protein